MIKRFVHYFFRIIERLTGKRVLLYTANEHNCLGMTATKAAGFWYVGNVYDTADIAYGIAQNGSVELEETVLVEKILAAISTNKQPVVYDIGANTGYYSLLAACKYNASTVAFEPVTEHVACLKESAELNNVADRVRIFVCALGEQSTDQELYLGGSGSSLNAEFLGKRDAERTIVHVDTLDTISQREVLTPPDFIKIDVEGHELKVLKGSKSLLLEVKPILFVEISATFAARDFVNQDYLVTFNLLEEMGYTAYRLESGHLVPHDATSIRPDGVRMYLFLHQDNHAKLKLTLDT